MTTETIIAFMVPTVAWLFAVALFLLGRFRPSRPIILMAWAYAAFGAGMLALYLSPFGFIPSRLLANAILLTAAAMICEALLTRSGRRLPRAAAAVTVVATMAALAWALAAQAGLATRIVAIGSGIGVLAAITALVLWRIERRQPADNAVLTIVLLVVVASFTRPLVFHFWADDGYGTEEMLFQSVYWVGVVLSAVFVLTAIALTMIAAIGLETIHALQVESGTDPLTGVLNRRGFERGAGALIRQARRQGLPVAFILCDLDRFKSVNDRHGHACGDRVIATFAGCLAAAAGQPHLVGRIGGEEFAVILHGATGATARLLAEGLRAEFGACRIDQLPDERFTASFGVAEMSERDQLHHLLCRADAALYEAKAAGRDRVRLAKPQPAVASGPESASA